MRRDIQGSAKEGSLGCVIPASWPPLATRARFTQTTDHSLADENYSIVWWVGVISIA